jgi:hypothetical protein
VLSEKLKENKNLKKGHMKFLNLKKSTVGLVIYSIGIFVGMLLSGAAVWGNIEAFLFESGMPAEEVIRNIKCPVLITSTETGKVTATFTNPGDRSAETTVRTYITDGLYSLIRQTDSKINLEPGETKELEWEIYPEDAAWERFILVRIYSLRSTPLPSRTGSCGIILVDLPFITGNQVVAFTSLVSAALMAAGIGIWVSANQPLSRRDRYATQIMIVLAALVLIGILLGVLAFWFPGAILYIFKLLFIVVSITYFMLAT